MQFIDTHIHLQDFSADFAPQVLNNPEAVRLLTICTKNTDFPQIAALANTYSNKIIPAFGIHPWYWQENTNIDELKDYLKQFPNALVGEIGVDGLKEKPTAKQSSLFHTQLNIAKEFNRPVIIHAARAFSALIPFANDLKAVKFVYHGFVKNHELIKFINSCGGYFGLGAHFLKQAKASEMFIEMPINKILFETDAPYQLPEETYNQTVQNNLTKLAAISQIPQEELAPTLIQNAKDFFRC